MTTCEDFCDKLEEHLDGVLPPEESQRWIAHANTCDPCALELAAAHEFKTLLEGEGREALEEFEAGRYTRRVMAGTETKEDLPRVAEEPRPAAPRTWLRARALRPIAVAAAAVLVVVAYGLSGADGPLVLAAGKPVTLAPGQAAVVGAAGEMRAQSETEVTLLEDSDGGRLHLHSGVATFFGHPDVRLAVEADSGVASGAGVAFQYADDGAGRGQVAVLAGEVSFDGGRGRPRKLLRAGDLMQIAPNGATNVLNHATLAELRVTAEMSTIEISSLRGDMARLREELAELRTEKSTVETRPAPVVSVEALDELPWDELGAAARELLKGRSYGGFDNPQRNAALARFLMHTEAIQAATGVANPLDALAHPAAIARMAPGFFKALAPEGAPPENVREVIVASKSAAEMALARMQRDEVPAEVLRDRLLLMQSMIRATREHLGDAAAAEVAGGLRGARAIVYLRRFVVGEETVEDLVAWRSKRFDLMDAQRDSLHQIAEDYLEQTLAAQEQIVGRFGEEDANALLFPRRRPWRTSRPSSKRPPKEPVSDAVRVDRELRNIDVKLALLAVRVDFERRFWELLRPDQRARGLSRSPALPTFKR